MSKRDTFDPDDIRKEDMKKLGEGIEGFVEVLTRIMVIPDQIRDEEKQIKKDMETVEELIKGLKKGKHKDRYFKDIEEWNFMD